PENRWDLAAHRCLLHPPRRTICSHILSRRRHGSWMQRRKMIFATHSATFAVRDTKTQRHKDTKSAASIFYNTPPLSGWYSRAVHLRRNQVTTRDSQPAAIPPSAQVMQLIWPGAMGAQAIYAAAKLRIAELLVEKSRTVQDIAQLLAVDSRSLHRLLRALASVGIFEETGSGTFRNTPLSETLRRDIPGSTGAWALFLGAPFNWRLWGDLEEAVRTGRPASYRVFGKSFWEHLGENAEDAAVFNNAMSAGSQMVAADIVKTYNFSVFQKIVEVGGGH